MADEYIQSVSEIYARAIFDLARDGSVIDQIGEELEQISHCIDNDKQFAEFLSSPSIANSIKTQMLEKVFSGKISELTMNLLMVMAQRDRLEIIRSVYAVYKSFQDDLTGRIYGTITTAFELDDSSRESIRGAISLSLSRDVVLNYKVNPLIIGGVTLQVGNKFIDGSIKKKLACMASSFMKNKVTDTGSVIEE